MKTVLICLLSLGLHAQVMQSALPGVSSQWATGYYSDQNGIESISQIPWGKYTHIVMFAAAPGTTGGTADGTVELHYLTSPDIDAIIAARPAGKKVLVCIKDNDSFLSAFAQATAGGLLSTFVSNIASFVVSNKFDGVDLDWEDNIDTSQYNALISALRAALPSAIITMANFGNATGVANTSQAYLNQINVECYDMDTSPGGGDCGGSDCSWFNSAILSSTVYERTAQQRIALFTGAGVAPAKIGVGIPFYGRINAAVDAPEVLGDFTQTTINYRDLVNNVAWLSGNMQYDATHEAEYLASVALNEFIPYTGTRGIAAYVAWMQAQGFGGFMSFTLDYEFDSAAAGDAQYPLSTALHTDLFGW